MNDNLNCLDKAALGIALLRTDTDPFEDKWAIFGGKFFISIVVATHFLLVLKDVLEYKMPPRLLSIPLILVLAGFVYFLVRMVTRSVSEIQKAGRPSPRKQWVYRFWGLSLCPGSLLLWIPLWFFLL